MRFSALATTTLVVAGMLLCVGCPNPTSNGDGEAEPFRSLGDGEYEFDYSASSEQDTNTDTWFENNWMQISVPVSVAGTSDVRVKIEVNVDNVPPAGTNPFVRIDDADLSTSGGSNLISNGEFIPHPYSSPLPEPPDPNAYNNWVPWNVTFEYLNSGYGSSFVNDDSGYGPNDTDAAIAWGNGGNYTFTLVQTVNSVPTGDYTASAYIVVGNVSGTVSINAIVQ